MKPKCWAMGPLVKCSWRTISTIKITRWRSRSWTSQSLRTTWMPFFPLPNTFTLTKSFQVLWKAPGSHSRGPNWAHWDPTWLLLVRPGGQKLIKTISCFLTFLFYTFWRLQRYFGTILVLSRKQLNLFRLPLGSLGAPEGPPGGLLAPLGGTLAPLWRPRIRLRAILEPSWSILVLPGTILDPIWIRFGVRRSLFATFCMGFACEHTSHSNVAIAITRSNFTGD